jgi:hypothetical protein
MSDVMTSVRNYELVLQTLLKCRDGARRAELGWLWLCINPRAPSYTSDPQPALLVSYSEVRSSFNRSNYHYIPTATKPTETKNTNDQIR